VSLVERFFTVTRLRKWFGTGFTAGITIGLMIFGGLTLLGFVGILLSGIGLAEAVFSCFVMFLLGMLVFNGVNVFLTNKDPRWMVVIIGYLVPKSMPVVLKDYKRDTYYSLAWPDDAGVWRCPIYYGTGVGDVKLNPNGSCGNESYIYFWQPLRDSDRMQFFLHNEDVVYFDDLAGMDRQDISKLVSKMRKEAQNVV
jgi:hypothetical protein